MFKIKSFTVDHDILEKGIYLSTLNDDIVTYDLRIKIPYKDEVLTNIELHSLEHLLASALRADDSSGDIVYVGPMGCATGFYIIFKKYDEKNNIAQLKKALQDVENFADMPGKSKKECGNNKTLDLQVGKLVAKECLCILSDKVTADIYATK